jgi:hypothetical protein
LSWQGTDVLSMNHVVEITGLKPFTTYKYYINAKDDLGNMVESEKSEFTTTILANSIVGLDAPFNLIKSDNVTIIWGTTNSSDSIVFYVKKGGNSWSWQGVDSLSNDHSVLIPELEPLVIYQYYVNTKDSNGNLTRSEIKEFTTAAASTSNSGTVINNGSASDYGQKANLLYDNKFESILAELNELKNIILEQNVKIKYLEKLMSSTQQLTEKIENSLSSFIAYGVDANTKKLGEGERAAVVYSYKSAFNKLPETESELTDMIKIANGRWPSVTNEDAEKKAKEQFKKIYKRDADMNNSKDNAAVTVMAYGLRQKAENRNLNSEKNGIKIFKNIYGRVPSSTEDWNIMQAITYSGATR